MMNKLRLDPFWDNRPRDIANLAKFASHELERPMNWQVVNLQRPWSDWMDSPVLYIASHQAPALKDEDYDKLRSFAEAGGLIFTHADSASSSFNNWAGELAKKLWPQYKLQDVPAGHELFKVNYRLTNPPALKMVTNGTRVLLVHSPTDISPVWQDRMYRAKKETFQLGVNLFLYAAGRGNFRNRLDSPYIPEPATIATASLQVARLKYAGPWDPEPYAWIRFSRYFQWNTGIGLTQPVVKLTDLKAGGEYSLAILTGNDAATFSDDQVKAVRAFVEGGGVLFIDACGGSEAFSASASRLMLAAFGPVEPATIGPADALVKGDGEGMENLTKPLIRQYAAEKLGSADGELVKSLSFGKGRVIYSPLDVTTGLLGTNGWGIFGYTPGYALALMKNVVLGTGGAGQRQ